MELFILSAITETKGSGPSGMDLGKAGPPSDLLLGQDDPSSG